MRRPSTFIRVLSISFSAALSGCAQYAVPGKAANFNSLGLVTAQREQQTDPAIDKLLEKKPLASFPATVAFVRIQDGAYANPKVQTFHTGDCVVVLTHDVEKPELFDALAKLPMLANLEPLNRLELPSVAVPIDEYRGVLLPNQPASSSRPAEQIIDRTSALRSAAASVHADMLLIYTFDDSFDDRDLASFITVITLGIIPTKSLAINCTASAVLIDTRNGYIYGAAEATQKKTTLANCWGEDAAADAVREQVEGAAFEKLCGEFQKTWNQVVKQYAPANATKPSN